MNVINLVHFPTGLEGNARNEEGPWLPPYLLSSSSCSLGAATVSVGLMAVVAFVC